MPFFLVIYQGKGVYYENMTCIREPWERDCKKANLYLHGEMMKDREKRNAERKRGKCPNLV